MSLFQTIIEWAYTKYVVEPEMLIEEPPIDEEVLVALWQKHKLKGIVRTDN